MTARRSFRTVEINYRKRAKGLKDDRSPNDHGHRAVGPEEAGAGSQCAFFVHQGFGTVFGSGPTDVDLARVQQQAYIDALEANGVRVHRLDADENHPDCMFVEDQAVVVDGHMLLPVPGHPSRVAEQPPIAEFLMEALEGVQTCTMGGEARMDGGDVIRLGDLFFVGRSSRTNDLGITSLRSLLDFLATNCVSSTSPNTPFTSRAFLQPQPTRSFSLQRGTSNPKISANFLKDAN